MATGSKSSGRKIPGVTRAARVVIPHTGVNPGNCCAVPFPVHHCTSLESCLLHQPQPRSTTPVLAAENGKSQHPHRLFHRQCRPFPRTSPPSYDDPTNAVNKPWCRLEITALLQLSLLFFLFTQAERASKRTRGTSPRRAFL
jgi:hypothetical protein